MTRDTNARLFSDTLGPYLQSTMLAECSVYTSSVRLIRYAWSLKLGAAKRAVRSSKRRSHFRRAKLGFYSTICSSATAEQLQATGWKYHGATRRCFCLCFLFLFSVSKDPTVDRVPR